MKSLLTKTLLILLTITIATAETKQPNILFIIADDASFDHFGVNGCTWVNTPNIDKIAAQGINFTSAYTPNPKCAPSRSVIITGRNPWQLEAAVNHRPIFPPKFKTYAEALSEHGYNVGMTGKGWGPGKAKERSLVGKEYIDHKVKDRPANQISTTDYTKNFEQFLNEHDKSKPFAFWLGCYEPHRKYELKSGIKNNKKLDSIPQVPKYWPDTEQVRHDMLDYAVEVEYFDSHVGSSIAVLESKGLLDNTLVIVTSDNGMPFPRVKGHPYHDSAHMPFMAMWKNGIKEPGRSFDQFVSFIDLVPTFMEIAGVSQKASGMEPWTGRSLLEVFKGGRDMPNIPQRDTILMGRERNDVGRPNDWGYPVRVIRKGNLFYIHNFEPTRWPSGNPSTGFMDIDSSPTKGAIIKEGEGSQYWKLSLGKRKSEELYDISKDPECVIDLSDNPEYFEQIEALKNELFQQLTQQGDLRMTDKGDWYDGPDNPYATSGKRNWYKKVNNGESKSKHFHLEDGM